ncbi:MAG: hypothetical protein AAFR97_06390, partial [Bacteroidota bacterium]
INRYALVLRPSTKLLQWAISEDPGLASEIDIDDTDDLVSVYLLPDFSEEEEAEEWLESNFQIILESLLDEWVPDDSVWPETLTLDDFEQYCEYAFTNMVIDTQDQSYDDEF